MGTVLLPQCANPIAVKYIIPYIISYYIYHISYIIISYHTISHFRDGSNNTFIENKCFSESVVKQKKMCKDFFWHFSPQWARASSFTSFLDHTQRRTTVGNTPIDE